MAFDETVGAFSVCPFAVNGAQFFSERSALPGASSHWDFFAELFVIYRPRARARGVSRFVTFRVDAGMLLCRQVLAL